MEFMGTRFLDSPRLLKCRTGVILGRKKETGRITTPRPSSPSEIHGQIVPAEAAPVMLVGL